MSKVKLDTFEDFEQHVKAMENHEWRFTIRYHMENPLYKARFIGHLEQMLSENFEYNYLDWNVFHTYDVTIFQTNREDVALFLKLKGFGITDLQDPQKYQVD